MCSNTPPGWAVSYGETRAIFIAGRSGVFVCDEDSGDS